MHPQLINFGDLIQTLFGMEQGPNLPLHTFGVLMGAGFVAGIAWGMREGRRWGLDSEMIFNLSFWVMIGSILGSRVLYVIIDLFQQGARSSYLDSPMSILAIWQGGLVWYGGFFGAFGAIAIFAFRNKLPIWRVGDICVPATFLGMTIGRLGCAAVGDDFGKIVTNETWVKWALVFTHPEALVYPETWRGEPLYPTQVFMAASCFFLFLVLWWTLKNKRFDGQVSFLAFMIYPINRSLIEIFRGDYQRGYFLEGALGRVVSTSQAISIPTFIAGVAVTILLARRAGVEMKWPIFAIASSVIFGTIMYSARSWPEGTTVVLGLIGIVVLLASLAFAYRTSQNDTADAEPEPAS